MRLLCVAVATFLCLAVRAAAGCWTITATDTVGYYPPMLGNGDIGVVMSADGLRPEAVYMASAEQRGNAGMVSHILPAVVPVSLHVGASGDTEAMTAWRQTLDMRRAAVTTSYSTSSLDVECTMRALRNMPHMIMAEVRVKALRDVDVTAVDLPVVPDELSGVSVSRPAHCVDGQMRHLVRVAGNYNSGRDAVVSSVAMVPGSGGWRMLSADTLCRKLRRGEDASFWVVAATCCTADFSDPWNEADRQVIYALYAGRDELVRRHESAWDSLWQSDIIIEGDDRLQEHIRSALYNIYSSMRQGSHRSIAPMGLTSGVYYGHIFWDADTWILPVLAVLHPELAHDMVQYRFDNMPAARRKAAAHGYRGTMFPWESDAAGEEATPVFALTGPLEHHITADVARGAWLYYCATADRRWLREVGYPLMSGCADFWVSRADRNPDGSYSIRNVVGADEYAIGVDDNAFTNAAARRALEYAAEAASILGEPIPDDWLDVAGRLKFHYMPGGKVLREFDGYSGQTIKQADVALLAYPLGIITARSDIEANIDYYAAVTDSLNGPAMTHSAMAVNYARLGMGDKAGRLVARAYEPNLRGAFHALSESPGNDRVYFMTGAGGLLQAVIFGYAGVEITSEGIRQLPSALPNGIRQVTVTTPHGIFTRRSH